MAEQLKGDADRGFTLVEAAIREGNNNVTTALDFAFAEVRAALVAEDDLVEESLDKYAGKQLVVYVLQVAAALVSTLAIEYGTDVESALRAIRRVLDQPDD